MASPAPHVWSYDMGLEKNWGKVGGAIMDRPTSVRWGWRKPSEDVG
jgi:hypothetical protein